MNNHKCFQLLQTFAIATAVVLGGCRDKQDVVESFQLNWFHDPTFVGEYRLTEQQGVNVQVKEGGTTVKPLEELAAGRATYIVLGADLFVEFIDKSLKQHEPPNVQCIFVDFQRNPVGWVLHPDAASALGLKDFSVPQNQINEWAATKIKEGSLRVGDKRGTETTSVWVQWKKLRGIPDSSRVEPVGFDSRVVLSAPRMLYPVYLNEEPFKLAAAIGRKPIIVDPAIDGVNLYGNMVVCKKDFAESQTDRIKTVQQSLRSAWSAVRDDIPGSAKLVMNYYKGVPEATVTEEVRMTSDFVFHGTSEAGSIDISPNGRLAQTLEALQNSGLVSTDLSFSKLRSYVTPP